MAVEVVDKQEKTNGPHRWVKGESGNPQGMKKGEFRRLLEKAIASSDADEQQTLAQYAVSRARKSDVVLVALLKKLVPDLKHVEGNMQGSIEFITKVIKGNWGKVEGRMKQESIN